MTTRTLPAALRARAEGLRQLETDVGLFIPTAPSCIAATSSAASARR